MNIEALLSVLALSSVAINFLHWRWHAGERFLYFPASGRLRAVFIVWSIAPLVAGIMFVTSFVPGVVFLAVSVCFLIGQGCYSIWSRHRQRRSVR